MGLDKFTQGDGALSPGMDPSMYQQRRNQIASLPPGPQKEAALAALLRDYAGEQSAAQTAQEQGFEMATAPGAQGTQLGGKYSTYVAASPLEHLASGLRQYKGYKGMKESKDKLKELSEQQQKAREDLARAGMGGGTQFGMYNRLP